MLFVAKRELIAVLVAITFAPCCVDAETLARRNSHQSARAVVASDEVAQLTGKERLGEKWKDEQRIDNCKVPPDKRGAKPRSESCAHLPTG